MIFHETGCMVGNVGKQVGDWDRRRQNLRILIAARGTNATQLALSAGLSPNTLTQFLSGHTGSLSSATLSKILPLLEVTSVEDLDTDNPLADPGIAIRRLVDRLSTSDQYSLLEELRARFPGRGQPRSQ